MASASLDVLLHRLGRDEALDAVDILCALVDWLRPSNPRQVAPVLGRIEELVVALDTQPKLQEAIRGKLQTLLAESRHLTLYTEIGLFSRRGFFRELGTRLYERINPAPRNRRNLKDILATVFCKVTDPQWVSTVPGDSWLRLFDLLFGTSEANARSVRRARDEVLYAVENLSIWIAAEELEPELLRLQPKDRDAQSAFVGLQREIAAYAREYMAAAEEPERPYPDDEHARVLLAQCAEQIESFRRRAIKLGSSVSLTYLLERLEQTVARVETLLDLLAPGAPENRRATGVSLFKELVRTHARRFSLQSLWQESIALLSRSVTEHASETGEHYITRTRAEYLQMLGSGAGAGVIIAFMALLKIKIVALGLTPGLQTLLVCLNYGLGFVFIHMLHFTVATKQPAMTAARFAAAVEQGDKGLANLRKLADLMIEVGRSQFIAVVGNLGVALPVAILVGWAYLQIAGTTLLPPEKVDYQLKDLWPITGLALFHAAIAGVWLFVSGLIAGFFDNRSAYLDLPSRLREHPLLRRIMSSGLRDRLAAYVEGNYGALAGNFFFGVLLGVTAYIGYLLALPLDIRHIAFSSANLGYVMGSEPLGLAQFAMYLGFVLLIGVVNLWVSFALAFYVALKSRGARIGGISRLLKVYFQRVAERPREFLFPPADEPDPRRSHES